MSDSYEDNMTNSDDEIEQHDYQNNNLVDDDIIDNEQVNDSDHDASDEEDGWNFPPLPTHASDNSIFEGLPDNFIETSYLIQPLHIQHLANMTSATNRLSYMKTHLANLEANLSWFDQNELTRASTSDASIVAYINDLLFSTTFDVAEQLRSIYTEPSDTLIINDFIEKCQLFMSLLGDNDKIFNMDVVLNVKKLILWVFSMMINSKYVPTVLRIMMQTNTIDDGIFLRCVKVGGNITKNLLMLSLLSDNIRVATMEIFSLTNYTKLLLTTDSMMSNCNYIEAAAGSGMLVNMLNDGTVDIDLLLDTKFSLGRNLLHLLVADMTDYAHLKHLHVIDGTHNLSDGVLAKLKPLAYAVDSFDAKPMDLCNIIYDYNFVIMAPIRIPLYRLLESIYDDNILDNIKIIKHGTTSNATVYLKLFTKLLSTKTPETAEVFKDKIDIIFTLIQLSKSNMNNRNWKLLIIELVRTKLLNKDNIAIPFGLMTTKTCGLNLIPMIDFDQDIVSDNEDGKSTESIELADYDQLYADYVQLYADLMVDQLSKGINTNIYSLCSKDSSLNVNAIKFTKMMFDRKLDSIMYERLAKEFIVYIVSIFGSQFYNAPVDVADIFTKSIYSDEYYMDAIKCCMNTTVVYKDTISDDKLKFNIDTIIDVPTSESIAYLKHYVSRLKSIITDNAKIQKMLVYGRDIIKTLVEVHHLPFSVFLGSTTDSIARSLHSVLPTHYNTIDRDMYVASNSDVIKELFINSHTLDSNYTLVTNMKNIFNLDNTFIYDSDAMDTRITKLNEETFSKDIQHIFKLWMPTVVQYNALKSKTQWLEHPELHKNVSIALIEMKFINREYYGDTFETVFKGVVNHIIPTGNIAKYCLEGNININDLMSPDILELIFTKCKTIDFLVNNETFIKTFNTYKGIFVSNEIIPKMQRDVLFSLTENGLFDEKDFRFNLVMEIIPPANDIEENGSITLFEHIIKCYDLCKRQKTQFFDALKDKSILVENIDVILKSIDGGTLVAKYIDSKIFEAFVSDEYLHNYGENIIIQLFEGYVDNGKFELAKTIYASNGYAHHMYYKDTCNVKRRINYLFKSSSYKNLLDNGEESKFDIYMDADLILVKTRDDVDIDVLSVAIIAGFCLPTLELAKLFPELIHTEMLDESIVKDIIQKSIDDEKIYEYVISCKHKSEKIIKTLLEIYISSDYIQFIDAMTKLDIRIEINSIDQERIQEISSNDPYLLRNLIQNKFIPSESAMKFKNRLGNYSISMMDDDETVCTFLELFTIEQLMETNKIGDRCLFAFMTSKEKIQTIIKKFDISELSTVRDRNGNNIYTYFAKYGLFNKIPPIEYMSVDNFGRNIIMNMCCEHGVDDAIILDVIASVDFQDISMKKDSTGLTCVHYIIKHRALMLEKLINLNIITKDILCTVNSMNETYLMWAIRTNKDSAIMLMEHPDILDESQLYSDYNSGSIMTYAAKYAPDLYNKIIQLDIFNDHILMIKDKITDIIDISSDTFKSGEITLNILQIASICDHELLIKLLGMRRKRVNSLMRETVRIGKNTYNLLNIALYNNPESAQVVLCSDLCDEQYLRATEQLMGKFEDVIDVQPASWYYLIQNSKVGNLHLTSDHHYYGYNYRALLKPSNISTVAHYILDKQELPTSSKDECQVCNIYKTKVLFTECKHKTCILCALQAYKCHTCRKEASPESKILM